MLSTLRSRSLRAGGESPVSGQYDVGELELFVHHDADVGAIDLRVRVLALGVIERIRVFDEHAVAEREPVRVERKP